MANSNVKSIKRIRKLTLSLPRKEPKINKKINKLIRGALRGFCSFAGVNYDDAMSVMRYDFAENCWVFAIQDYDVRIESDGFLMISQKIVGHSQFKITILE